MPRVLDDPHVTIAIINFTFAMPIGLLPFRDSLFNEEHSFSYVIAIVPLENHQNDDKVKKFIKPYESPQRDLTVQKGIKGGTIEDW